ncbi:murein biosynthesis integral membrane protein MurJ [Lentisphaerota bacterium ZTH]|nr:murein biosynthesis integral membrane protein MurJ [Lentisphaerota bacterium]WET06197.1 murein biosynthesis integral membrane protein MurJ [Lentisphaerota bacterium ZTH]
MHKNRIKLLKSSSGVALATLISRVLGLLRVILEAKVLGGGATATAWQLAFMAPNMLRRLLGEGALGTALVPMLSHSIAEKGSAETRRQLSVIFGFLGALLALMAVIFSGAAVLIEPWVQRDYGRQALLLLPLLMPYAFFICFVGVITSVLNSVKVFFLPAMGALLLNIAIIAVLLAAPGFQGGIQTVLETLAAAVVFAGVIQFVLMLLLLARHGMFPALNISVIKNLKVIKDLWQLTLPGLVGASALQISLVADRLVAYLIGSNAIPALTYTDRIVYLPLSVIALALSSVLLPSMSQAVAEKDYSELFAILRLGIRLVMYLCVPIAVFAVIFREPILKVLYMRGKFDDVALRETSLAALYYCSGIPFFAAVKIILPAFYARKDMKTPLRISLICIVVNIILNLILMGPLAQGGIALATVISSILNIALMLWLLHRDFRQYELKLKAISFEMFRDALAAGALTVLLWYTYPMLPQLKIRHLPLDLLPLTISGAVFCLGYLLLTAISGSPVPRELFKIFKK